LNLACWHEFALIMDIELQLTVENLLARYVHAIDNDQLEAWPDFFVEQARYRITTAENQERGLPLSLVYADSRAMLRDRVNALRHANVYEAQRYRHTISSVLVERIDMHAARAVSAFQVVRIMHSGETMLFASGRYLDRIRIAGEAGIAQFEERIVVIDSRRVDTLMAIPL
jgi:3-phenylpropionate/cinnamic acid dioxygenase small subunit